MVVKKANRFIKQNHILLLSFSLPIAILGIAYFCYGIFPFGSMNILLIDLFHQYAPFISDLQDKIRTGSSMFYSWTGGLGTNYMPQFSYYLSSPLNILIVFFPKQFLSEAILFLILIKVGLCGACFNYYLKNTHQKQNLVTVGFSLLYALSGYVLAYFWNIMWLDALYLLPLVILGLVWLIRDGRYALYCISLTVLLLSNFYMAFFVCLFILLYFPVCLFQYQHFNAFGMLVKRTLQTGLFSILSVGMSAILLLPTFSALQLTSAAKDVFPKTLTYYADLFDYISRHFTAASLTIREGLPNMYCGMIVLILLPIYFLNRDIPVKEKLLQGTLLFILFVSFNLNVLDFIWHGFHYPNQLPFRFSFVYIFIVLSVCFSVLEKINEFGSKYIGFIGFFLILITLLSQKLNENPPEHLTIYISIAFIFLYCLVLTIEWIPVKQQKYQSLALFIVIFVEICVNTILSIGAIGLTERFSLRDGYASGKEPEQIQKQLSQLRHTEDSFFRAEIYPPKTINDPHLYHYNGLSIFSSTSPMQPVKMMENLGYRSNGINSYQYTGSTAVLDSIFGIKYLLYRGEHIEEDLYQEVASSENVTVYKNPYALPLGFHVPSELVEWNSAGVNPFEVQNGLMEKISGVKNIFVPLEQEQGVHSNMDINPHSTQYFHYQRPNAEKQSTVKIKMSTEKKQPLYLYLDVSTKTIHEGFVMAGDRKIPFDTSRSTLVNVGYCDTSDIELELVFEKDAPKSGSFKVFSCALNKPEFEKAITTIKKHGLDIEHFSNSHITGSIHAENNGFALITVPYDKGWHVKVDGREIQTQSVSNGLLCFEVNKGPHELELWFFPDKFFAGMAISIASVILFALIGLVTRYRKNNP